MGAIDSPANRWLLLVKVPHVDHNRVPPTLFASDGERILSFDFVIDNCSLEAVAIHLCWTIMVM